MKICSKCGENKSLSDFYFRKDTGTHRKECKSCVRSRSIKYHHNHRDDVNARHRDYFKVYFEENKEHINKKNREYWIDKREEKQLYDKDYRQSEKGRDVAYRRDMKRRSSIHAVKFKPHQRVELLNRDNWVCQCCGVKVHDNKESTPTKAEIDHIIPISKGGTSEPDNLQVLCRTCNRSKADKILA